MGDFLQNNYDILEDLRDICVKDAIENPKVSIIVPAYNVEKYIEKCLKSLLQQTLKEIEIIVINDGSTDNTSSIISTFANADSRIRVINQENQKQGAARNRGIEIAKGEHIGFVDSDDEVDSNYCEALLNTALKYDADIVTTNILKHKKFYKKWIVNYKKNDKAIMLNDKIKLCSDKTKRFFYATNKMFKKSFIQENQIFFSEGCYYEDIMFMAKAILKANLIVSCSKTIYHYYKNPNSTVKSKDITGKKKQDYINAYKELQEFARENSFNFSKKY